MSTRYREFSLISYLDRLQITKVLEEHNNHIRHYAFIMHDKDVNADGELKETHFHIVLKTYNNHSLSAVRRWFYGFVDKDGKDINTLSQVCKDIYNAYDYLTHKNVPDKYQYSETSVISDCKSYFQGKAEYQTDTTTEMLFDLVQGVSYRTLCRKYGRDFIYHYSNLRILAHDLVREEQAFGVDSSPDTQRLFLNDNEPHF